MRIEILYFEGCPNHIPAVDLVHEVVRSKGIDAEVVEVEITNPGDVDRMRFLGSPSVRVEGVDIDPGARSRTDYGYSCRTYRGSGGLPPREMIEDAFASLPGAESETCTEDCCASEVAPAEGVTQEARPWMSAGIFTAGGSFGAAVLSSACCWLPLLLLGFGVSAGGIAAFFESARPLFLGLTSALLAIGFYVAYFREEKCVEGSDCEVSHPRLQRFSRGSLWIALLGASAFAAFPLYVNALPIGASQEGIAEDLVAAEVLSLPIAGMTCAGCATTVEQTLLHTPGVIAATVDFEASRAEIRLDPNAPASHALLSQTLKNSGFAIAAAVDTNTP